MDRPGIRQVPEGSGEQKQKQNKNNNQNNNNNNNKNNNKTPEETGCKVICGAPLTSAVKGWLKVKKGVKSIGTSGVGERHPGYTYMHTGLHCSPPPLVEGGSTVQSHRKDYH